MRVRFVTLLALLSPLQAGLSQPAVPGDPSPHRVLRVQTAPGVQLEVLDWGGAGVPIVFLPGGGNTAHVFDDFAPRFTRDHRVLGITRRGYGASDVPESGYDPATRAADVVAVLDALGLDRVVLVGHSFGGDEVSRVASTYPWRVRALVYLDAVDYGPDFLEMLSAWPELPMPQREMTQADSASFAAVVEFRTREQGVAYPPGETLAQALFDERGRFTGYRPRADRQVMESIQNAELSRIRAPALGIHSRSATAEQYFEEEAPLFDDGAWVRAREFFAVFEGWKAGVLHRFQTELAGYELLLLPRAHHYFFLDQAEVTERLVREFLARVVPPGP